MTPSTLIPVTTHRDLVWDASRNALYITTTAGTVERWDVGTQALLSPYTVGTFESGADITPDASALYVAENKTSATQGFVHKVNLATGTVTDLSYDLQSLEGGAWEIAVGSNGLALFDTTFNGSGFVPMRQITLSTDTLSIRTDIGDITQNTHIVRGADRSLFLIAQSNISNGPLGTYDPANDDFPTGASTNRYQDSSITAVNRNGTLVAEEIGGAASVMDRNLHIVANLSGADGGLAFDPNLDVLYAANSSADQVIAYDTNTWTEKYRLAIGETIGGSNPLGNGEMAVSRDGTWLFLATSSGVREIALPTATGVAATVSVTGFPAYVKAGVAGALTVTVRDPAGNIAVGYTGTVHFTSNDTAAGLPADYTFTAADAGAHTFTATLNTAGTKTITVTDTANGGLTGTESAITVHTAVTTLIPVTNYRDLVYDPARGLLYITTTAGTLQRYDVANQTLLAPFYVGNSLTGADITPDSGALYVGDGQRGATQGWFHKVNLTTGAVTNLSYDLYSLEGGSWEVAVGSNGLALVDTSFEGSGFVPMRQIRLSDDSLTSRADYGPITQNTHIVRGADRSLFLIAMSNISNGPLGTYDPANDVFPPGSHTNRYQDGSLTVVNRNGTLVAEEMGGVASVMDKNLHIVANLAGADGGLVFDPNLDVLYAASSATSQIIAYDTNTWTEKYRFAIGETIGGSNPLGSGEMAVSNDGKWLFLATSSGVRVFGLPSATGIAATFHLTRFPAYVKAGVAGTFQVTVKDPAGNIAAGYTGTVHFTSTDLAVSLPPDYTFTAADAGVHTFTATLNTAGTKTITVTDTVNSGLIATQSGITVHTTTTTVISVTTRRAIVYDAIRGLLYMATTTGTVERYDIANQTLLAPFQVGVSLRGADITPDGNTLYVADAQRGATQGWFHKVDLNTGVVTDNLRYDLGGGEGGAWNVIVGPNGIALTDTSFEGSGFVPIRQITLSDDSFTVRTDYGPVTQNTSIVRGADRSLFLLTLSNISTGPVATYDAINDDFPHGIGTSTYLDSSVSAVNRNGTLEAVDLFGTGIVVYDQALNVVHTFSGIHGGVGFDPLKDLLYIADSGTNQVEAYDTSAWALQFQLAVPEGINSVGPLGAGVMAFSNDGRFLFLNSPTGVHVFTLPTNYLADTGFPSPQFAGAAGTFTITAKNASGNTLTGYTGTVHFTSSDPVAVLPPDYTFVAPDNGTHTFTATLNTPGTQALFATDAVNGIGGIDGNILVKATGPASTLVDTGFPSPITAGTAGSLTVTAKDSAGNVAVSYRGTIHFTSSDGQAGLPTDYTFVAADAGIHTFSIALKTVGSQSITATDTVSSGISGSQTGITVNPTASDDGFFVSGTFHDLLGRAVGTQEFRTNLAPIDAARFALLPSFSNGFVFSTEYFTDQVKAYYQKYFGRAADPGALAYWPSALQAGTTDEQLIATLVGSLEYFNKHGGANLSFLQAAYQDILGRSLDPAGQTYWLAQLQAGTPRATVATSLLSSTEYRRNLVASYYSTFLGRTASSTESAGAVNALANGLRDESLINIFVSSVEYFKGATLGGDTNKTWLTSLYQKILNRAPDTGGLNGALNALLNDYAVQRQTEVTSLIGSKEYRTDVVNGLYQKYLLRAADAGALAFWVPALQAGTATDEQLIASLVGTQEYFTKHGGTNVSFLQAAYLDILGRPLDSSGQAYWLGQLQAGVPRINVATTLLSTLEHRSNLVSGFYTTYLGRPDSAGIAYWAGQLGLGVPDEQVIDYLLTSNEYFLKAHTYP